MLTSVNVCLNQDYISQVNTSYQQIEDISFGISPNMLTSVCQLFEQRLSGLSVLASAKSFSEEDQRIFIQYMQGDVVSHLNLS